MKRLVLLILILFSVNVSFAQVKEQLSEKEKARREKNIQAGNPFKRFGYKPKIATLSKGKYLEFHDLDTIMRIGSFVFNTRQKKITGYVNLDTVHSEATFNPQLISRWLSPDPLCEEFPSWSPYNFTMNNPIRFIDPNGKAPEDIIVKGKNGSSITVKTDLIDISVNAGGLVGDLGGNYTLEGEDILVATLDIVGIVDPTGAADVVSGSIEMKNGNFWSGLASYAGVVPLIGDAAKIGKLPKHLKTIEKAIDALKSEKKVDFIVTPKGVAVSKNQKQMRQGFDAAGFPKKNATKTTENGVIHTVPTNNGKVDVRTMDGSANHPKRAVITHPGTNSPKTPEGRATRNKSDNHIEQF